MPKKTLTLKLPEAKGYRTSRLVDAATGRRIMLPITPETQAAARAGKADGESLRRALTPPKGGDRHEPGFESLFASIRKSPVYWTEVCMLGISSKLLQAQQEKKLSTEKIAKAAGMTEKRTYKIMTASTKKSPTIEEVCKIAHAMGLEVKMSLEKIKQEKPKAR